MAQPSTDGTGVRALTSAAPPPNTNPVTHNFTDIIHISFTGKKRSYAGSLDALLKDALEGTGTVDLVKIELSFKTSSANQTVRAGFCEAGSALSLDVVCMKSNGVNFTSNANHYGQRLTELLVPEDTLSTQIRPIAADRPMIKLLVECDEGVTMSLQCYVAVKNMRQRYLVLN